MLITAAEAAKELLVNDNIMIITHTSPDGDTLGSAFALYYALTAMGKRIKIRCSDDLPVRFSYLYKGYVDNDFEEEYVVSVDVAALQLFGEKLSGYKEKIDLCIDHHPSNGMFAKQTFLDHKVSANCELIFEILTILNLQITKLIANCLYTGIATDSGCFKYSNTTASTHVIAAKLVDAGAEHSEINRFLFDTKSKSRIAIEQKVLNAVEYYFHDKVAIVAITKKMIEESNADESELDGVSAIPRTIEGVFVGVTLREKSEGVYKVSVRTAGEYDACEICAQFGGGGHKRAAGCLIEDSEENVKKRIVEIIEKMVQ